jgi:hypothetical protein
MAGSLAAIWLIWLLARRLGAISHETSEAHVTASAYDWP